MAAVDHRRLPVDPPGPIEPAQQLAMHGREHAGALPLRKSPMRRGRRAAQLAPQMSPRDPGEQHEHDRAKAHAVIDAWAAASRVWPVLGQQRLDHLPQLVRICQTDSDTHTSRSPVMSTQPGFAAAPSNPSPRRY
jgi:hypothetical protein